MDSSRFVLFFTLAAATGLSLHDAQAKPVPSPLFGDHGVLQQQKPIPVWGRAEPGEKVTVAFAGMTRTATADAQGRWKVTLDALPATSEGRELSITTADNAPVVFKDVVVGEVWLASGQSNMKFPVDGAANASAEMAAANYPLIRQFAVTQSGTLHPTDKIAGNWVGCSPGTAGGFGAVAYFFARDVHTKLNVPIGILLSSWGGTPAEAWTRREVLNGLPELKEEVARQVAEMERAPAEQAAWPALQAAWEKQNGVDDTENAGFKNGWAAPEFDDQTWSSVKTPMSFKTATESQAGGVLWLRKTVDLPPESAGKGFRLSVGYMTEQYDTAYFNGVEIGHTGDQPPGYYTASRGYGVPGKLVKAGQNVIALRLVRHDAKGGLYTSGKTLGLPVPNPATVDDQWKVKLERDFPVLAADALARRPLLNTADIKNAPSALYNGMIQPLMPYALRGAIWYQGESNTQPASRATYYRTLFPAMITDWRAQWDMGDFPFYFVQLANNDRPNRTHIDSAWAALRESQLRTLQTLPNTGMAVAIDIGSDITIHPLNKQDVGKRLALWARAHTYGEKGLIYKSPLYKSAEIEGGKMRLRFDTGGAPLIAGKKTGLDPVVPTPEAKLEWFEVAGADGKYAWADAVIEGDSVVLTSPEVSAPVKARYGWATNPEGCNLYNAAGLPASPFRTQE
ncbi:MAG: sialate O-acetylesterase [Verrucomicrobiota bacterium]